MSLILFSCNSLTNVDLSNFNTQNVTHINQILSKYDSLTNVGLSYFNTENATDMSEMF